MKTGSKGSAVLRCSICEELAALEGTKLSQALGDPSVRNAIAFVSANYAVIPSLGPLTVGHCLVVSRRHSSSILLGMENEADRLEQTLQAWGQRCNRRIGVREFLAFEHGARNVSPAKELCSTCHGHLHILPLSVDSSTRVISSLRGELLDDLRSPRVSRRLQTLDTYVVAFSFSLEEFSPRGVIANAANLPSQHLRRLVAKELGTEGWDWKRSENIGILRETVNLGFEPNLAIA